MTTIANASQLLNDLATFDAQLSPSSASDRGQEVQETPPSSDSDSEAADEAELHRSQLHLIVKSTSNGISATSSRRIKGGTRKQKSSLATGPVSSNPGNGERRGRRSGGHSSSRNLLDDPHSRRSSSYHGREKFDAEFTINLKQEDVGEKPAPTTLGKLKQQARSRSVGRKSFTKNNFDNIQELSQNVHAGYHGDTALAPYIDVSRRSNSADARRRKRRSTAEAILMAQDAKQTELSDPGTKGVLECQETSSIGRIRRSNSADARRRRRRSSSEAPEISQMALMVDNTYAEEETSPTKDPTNVKRDDADVSLGRRMSKWEGRRRRHKSNGDFPPHEVDCSESCSIKENVDDLDRNRRSNSFDTQRRRRHSASDTAFSEDVYNAEASNQRKQHEEEYIRRSGSADGRRRKKKGTEEAFLGTSDELMIRLHPTSAKDRSDSQEEETILLDSDTNDTTSKIVRPADDDESNDTSVTMGHEVNDSQPFPCLSDSGGDKEVAHAECYNDFPDALFEGAATETGINPSPHTGERKIATDFTSDKSKLSDNDTHVSNAIESHPTNEAFHKMPGKEVFGNTVGNGDRRKLLNKQLAVPSMRFGSGSGCSSELSGQSKSELGINDDSGSINSMKEGMAVATSGLRGIFEQEEESESKSQSFAEAKGFGSLLSPNKVVQLSFKPTFPRESEIGIAFHKLEEDNFFLHSNANSPHVKRMNVEGVSISEDWSPFHSCHDSPKSYDSEELEVNTSARLSSKSVSFAMLQREYEQAESKVTSSLSKIKECEDAIQKLMEELAHHQDVYEAAKLEKVSLTRRMESMQENMDQA